VPGRPTCLTVVGRKTFSSKVEAIDNELDVKSEQPLKEKKKKGKGKEDKRTVSTSGILIPLQNFLLASAELRLGSLRCHYGDGNENVKKQLVKISKTTT